MIAIDTNVLIRILVDDPGQPQQITKARTAAAHAEQVYIAQIVQVELVWVLSDAYVLDKNAIVGVLEELAVNRAYVLQEEDHFRTALSEYRSAAADFADYLILAASRAEKLTLFTFDRQVGKVEGASIVS